MRNEYSPPPKLLGPDALKLLGAISPGADRMYGDIFRRKAGGEKEIPGLTDEIDVKSGCNEVAHQSHESRVGVYIGPEMENQAAFHFFNTMVMFQFASLGLSKERNVYTACREKL